MKLLIFLVATFYCLNGACQSLESFFPLAYNDEGYYDSLIRSSTKSEISSSYFVITYPITGATTSWAPQFIETYKNVKRYGSSVVLVLYNNAGIREKDIDYFLKYSLNLDEKEKEKLVIIKNDSLYSELTKGNHLVRLQYYFRGKRIYNEADKWHKSGGVVFPREQISIGIPTKVKLQDIDSFLVKERDALIPSINPDEFFLLTDTKNELLRINASTGKVTSVLHPSQFPKATELYCNYKAMGDTAKCAYAKKWENYVDSTNRKTISIDGVTPVSKEALLLIVSAEVMEKSDADYSFTNDEGDRTHLEEGQPALNAYTFFIYYNLKSKEFTINNLNDFAVTDSTEKYIMAGNGLRLQDSVVITTTTGFGRSDANTIGLVQLQKQKGNYLPAFKEPGPLHNDKLNMYFSKAFFYNFVQQNYFSYNCDNNIYLEGRIKNQSSFIGNGDSLLRAETFKSYLEEPVEQRINFLIHAVHPVMDNSLLAAYINFQGKPILEVKSRLLKTIDVIELDAFPYIADYHRSGFREDMIIHNNKLIFKIIENNEIYLLCYPILSAN